MLQYTGAGPRVQVQIPLELLSETQGITHPCGHWNHPNIEVRKSQFYRDAEGEAVFHLLTLDRTLRDERMGGTWEQFAPRRKMSRYDGIFTPDELRAVLPLVNGRYDPLLVESRYLDVDEERFQQMTDDEKQKLKAGIDFGERLKQMAYFLAYRLSSTLRDRESSDLSVDVFPFQEPHSPTFELSDLHRRLHESRVR